MPFVLCWSTLIVLICFTMTWVIWLWNQCVYRMSWWIRDLPKNQTYFQHLLRLFITFVSFSESPIAGSHFLKISRTELKWKYKIFCLNVVHCLSCNSLVTFVITIWKFVVLQMKIIVTSSERNFVAEVSPWCFKVHSIYVWTFTSTSLWFYVVWLH